MPIPTDVALTTMSARGDVVDDADPRRPAPARRPLGGALGVRLTTAIVGRAGSAERVDDAARRAAGAEHGDRGAADVDARRGQRGDEAGAVGAVRRRVGRRASTTTVLTERSAAAAGSSSSTAAATSSLCGIVTDSPPMPSVRIAVERRGAVAGRDVERDVHPVEPGGGERGVVERRRQGVARRASRSPRRRASRPVIIRGRRRPRRACDVGLVLLGRGGERVAAVLVGEHVVEVLARRRLGQAGAERVARRAGSAPG